MIIVYLFQGDGEKVKVNGEVVQDSASDHYFDNSFAPSGYDSDYDNVPKLSEYNNETLGVAHAMRGEDEVEQTVMRATGCTVSIAGFIMGGGQG